ncbi:MAG TPA: tripartite tricarboxylate transporter substrate binding protein [Burkholderiales bacterium]|nr:tripartite tricarboxylate transporter substrate binding protein [Burkholderiales bacterium]
MLLTTFAPTDAGVAADYPVKPVRLVVPFPPGGTLDILARGLAPDLAGRLGQQIVVENRPGANGVIGYELVARAPADGYTMLIGGGSGIAVHPALLSKLSYDPVKAFAPVSMLATFPSVLIATPSFPANSVEELIALAKATPGKLTYGSPGTGNVNHLVGETFKSLAGVDLVHAPYKGAALVVTDVIAGHIPIGFVLLPGALPQMRAGKLKALAVTSDQRVSAAPDLPTMAEAGVSGLDLFDWAGILVPAGTPHEVISRLNRDIAKAVRSPEIRRRWIEQGFEPRVTTTDGLAAAIQSDVDKWGRIVRQAGIRAE